MKITLPELPIRQHEETAYNPVARYLLEISYDGGSYSGWQIQPHCIAVQQVLQEVLSRLFGGHFIHLLGSSRTDAGVHALGFAASFLVPERPNIPPDRVKLALNNLLPASIRIRNVYPVPLHFHARYDAQGKAYAYILNLGEETPFSARYSWHMRRPLDLEKLRAAADVLTGTHDFSSFVVERKKIEDAVRTIYRIELVPFGQYLAVLFVGNGFLYKMIRCLMGTLMFAATNRLTTEQVREILETRNRLAAPDTAPPHGLFLMQVFYDQQELMEYRMDRLPFC